MSLTTRSANKKPAELARRTGFEGEKAASFNTNNPSLHLRFGVVKDELPTTAAARYAERVERENFARSLDRIRVYIERTQAGKAAHVVRLPVDRILKQEWDAEECDE